MKYDFEKMIRDNINTDLDKELYQFLKDIVTDKESLAGVFDFLNSQSKRRRFLDYVYENKLEALEDIIYLADDLYYEEDE